ncbi:hypothetical protein D6783_03125 [Candidatus Woesearchaeota archaeon]|nr:MAG: hypothetical protein D6783_03125 [Candidatus Woesearchaeota archaeon]
MFDACQNPHKKRRQPPHLRNVYATHLRKTPPLHTHKYPAAPALNLLMVKKTTFLMNEVQKLRRTLTLLRNSK